MRRAKIDRDNLIIKKIKRGEYKIDIAKEFRISPSMITKIWKRYLQNNKIKVNKGR